MKTLLTSTALAVSLAIALPTAAAADGHARALDATMASEMSGQRIYLTDGDLDAGLLEDWDEAGELSEIILAPDGTVEAVIAEVGGFLGLGEREVAIDPARIAVLEGVDGAPLLVATGTRAELESAEAWNEAEPYVMGRTEHVDAIDYEGTGQTTAGSVNVIENREGAPVTPMNDMEIEGTTTNVADLDEGTVVDNPQTPATAVIGGEGAQTTMASSETPDGDNPVLLEQDALRENGTVTVNGDTVVAETGSIEQAPMDGDAELATGDGVVEGGTDGILVDNAAEGDVAVQAELDGDGTRTDESIVMESDGTGDVVVAQDLTEAQTDLLLTAPTVDRDGFVAVTPDEIMLPEIDDVALYGIDDDRIGEIDELIEVTGLGHPLAILEVGGFLGLGEHTVAVPLTGLTFLRDADGEMRAYIEATEEQLEGLPEFEG